MKEQWKRGDGRTEGADRRGQGGAEHRPPGPRDRRASPGEPRPMTPRPPVPAQAEAEEACGQADDPVGQEEFASLS
jgi:hypothetical protein